MIDQKTLIDKASDLDNIDAFVGPNSTHYAAKWIVNLEQAHDLDKLPFKLSLNLWAFFFPAPWLYLRKFYLLGCACLAFYLVAFFLANGSASTSGILLFLPSIILSKVANHIYLLRYIAAVKRFANLDNDKAFRACLKDVGGRSWLSSLFLMPIMVVLLMSFIGFGIKTMGVKFEKRVLSVYDLPLCDSDAAKNDLAMAVQQATQGKYKLLDLSDMKQTSLDTVGNARNCEAKLTLSSGPVNGTYSYLLDSQKKKYLLHLSTDSGSSKADSLGSKPTSSLNSAPDTQTPLESVIKR